MRSFSVAFVAAAAILCGSGTAHGDSLYLTLSGTFIGPGSSADGSWSAVPNNPPGGPGQLSFQPATENVQFPYGYHWQAFTGADLTLRLVAQSLAPASAPDLYTSVPYTLRL